MPFLFRGLPLAVIPAALSLLLAACGSDQADGNGADVEMMGLEKADGTINDAMTDLDGVQVEGTAMVETGNGNTASAGAIPAAAASNESEAPSAAEEEVVADQ